MSKDAFSKIQLRTNHIDPLFDQLRAHIENLIASKELEAGQKLPSQSEIANKLDVSLATVRRAIQCLDEDNYVDIRHGKGTFVSYR